MAHYIDPQHLDALIASVLARPDDPTARDELATALYLIADGVISMMGISQDRDDLRQVAAWACFKTIGKTDVSQNAFSFLTNVAKYAILVQLKSIRRQARIQMIDPTDLDSRMA